MVDESEAVDVLEADPVAHDVIAKEHRQLRMPVDAMNHADRPLGGAGDTGRQNPAMFGSLDRIGYDRSVRQFRREESARCVDVAKRPTVRRVIQLNLPGDFGFRNKRQNRVVHGRPEKLNPAILREAPQPIDDVLMAAVDEHLRERAVDVDRRPGPFELAE